MALESDIHHALATEKLDGTCCYVTPYRGGAHLHVFCFSVHTQYLTLLLWFALQEKCTFGLVWIGNPPSRRTRGSRNINTLRRPVKVFIFFRITRFVECYGSAMKDVRFVCFFSTGFTWNVEDDFRTVPESWIPARRVQYESGHPVPDEQGHIPGKRPLCSVQDRLRVILKLCINQW